MNRFLKGLTYIAVVVLSGAVSYGAMLPFEKGDSLETLRAKISHNGYKFKVKRNRIFDMPEEQKKLFFSRHRSEFPAAASSSDDAGPLSELLDMQLPASFDWRNYNGHSYIGPIRDQGSCGSCYAFAAAAAAEGTYNAYLGLYDGACVDFSESFIAFCLTTLPEYAEHFRGCYGADYEYMELEALTDRGICLESYFPYRDYYQSCPDAAWDAPKAVFDSWYRIPCGDVNAIKAAIMTYGVVDAAVIVTSGFAAYSSGVYEDTCQTCYESPCYYTPTDHAISLVGWDDNPPEGGGGCWILRNSWGEDWGEGGYMRIRYWSAYVACEACYLTYSGDQLPTPAPTPTATPTSPPTTTPPLVTTPTPTPSMTPTNAPTASPAVTATPMATQTPTRTPTAVVDSVMKLTPSDDVVLNGDFFAMDFSVGRTIVGLDKIVEYVLLKTPQGAWFSFVPNGPAKIAMRAGIEPAVVANRIAPLEARIFSGVVGETLAKGDYWFGAAAFEAGRAVTLDNWRSQAMYYSEATVEVR